MQVSFHIFKIYFQKSHLFSSVTRDENSVSKCKRNPWGKNRTSWLDNNRTWNIVFWQWFADERSCSGDVPFASKRADQLLTLSHLRDRCNREMQFRSFENLWWNVCLIFITSRDKMTVRYVFSVSLHTDIPFSITWKGINQQFFFFFQQIWYSQENISKIILIDPILNLH